MSFANVAALLSSYLGLALVAYRLLPTLPVNRGAAQAEERVGNEGLSRAQVGLGSESSTGAPVGTDGERVSIVVPARNEEANLPALLTSLLALQSCEIDIIVVDDGSRDRTPEIVSEFASRDPRVRLLRGEPRPPAWAGKNWACHQGAQVATGDFILFTDADTVHRPAGLLSALNELKSGDLDLLSALPYHLCPSLWEKLLGPFQMMVFISSAAFSKPRDNQLFAIGQFLLFKKKSYFAQGGHFAIQESLADDLDLAKLCMKTGGKYGVDKSGEVYDVRMYPNFFEFVNGWRRIFRIGFSHASLSRVIEVYLVIACLMMNFRFSKASAAEALASVLAIVIFVLAQRRYGRFSWLGPVLTPFSLGVFVYVSGLSAVDRALKRDLKWRGRKYKSSRI
jgi:glycosyltransferase involved in cell wall biosynthesis